MTDSEAIHKITTHLLGKDWYSYYTRSEDINDEIVESIIKKYRAVNETPVSKWRRKHKRCYFCDHLRCIENPMGYDTWICNVKGNIVNIDIPRPFCKPFELRMEKEL